MKIVRCFFSTSPQVFVKLFFLAVLLFPAGCKTTSATTSLPHILKEFHDPASKTVLVAAHRGAHKGNFENSIASTLRSIELGVDIIEVDVRTTKDGKLVLMHDSSIDRTTTGEGKVGDLTFEQIRKYRLKAPDGRISKEKVPTFEEFLEVAKGKIMIDIDMKTDNVEGIFEALKKTGATKEVFYFDNDYEQLDRVAKIHKGAKIMPRAYNFQMADSAITRFSPEVVHIDSKFYTTELTKMLRANKARIWINTLGDLDDEIRKGNGRKAIREATKHGANIIQTDEPETVLRLLREMGLRD